MSLSNSNIFDISNIPFHISPFVFPPGYDCFTGDACSDDNSTWSWVINNKAFCCLSGDGISYSSRAFKFYSSKRIASNDTSVKYDGSKGDNDEDEHPGKGDRKGDGHIKVTCKCGAVDNKELGKDLESLYNRMFKSFRDWFQWW